MTERLPPVCSADQIRGAYHVGLRITWEENEIRDTWEVEEVDDASATTRFTAADGTDTRATSTFESLSAHSAFPVGTKLTRETFDTPLGPMAGTHAVVVAPDGDRHFYFADAFPGPPMIIEGPGMVRRQVDRSDAS
jgi:hypothetical protein